MPRAAESSVPAHLRHGTAVFVGLIAVLLGLIAWDAYRDRRLGGSHEEITIGLAAESAEASQFQRKMNRSARMAAATSDPAWTRDYRRDAARLDRLIQQVDAEDAGAHRTGEDIRHASRALAAINESALALAGAGNAPRVNEKPTVTAHRERAVEAAMGRFDASFARRSAVLDAEIHADERFDGATSLASILLLVGAGFGLYAKSRWQADIVEGHRQLGLKSSELASLNDALESRVRERTRELTESNLATLNMMEDAIREREHADKARERIDYLAYYDVLTGLANRNLFVERVAQFIRIAAADGHKLAVAMIDLERFRNVNETLGQPAGDELLRQVGAWLVHDWGDASLLARLGADHFAVVVPVVAHEGDVARALERSMDALVRNLFKVDAAELRVAAKAGVALFPDDSDSADGLFKRAEAALKKAKASGERYLFYAQKMTEAVAGKLTLENQLRHALDNEEFVLFYQPKMSLETGRIVGAEALIRWNDPRTGLVPPGMFIPILEETGLISAVGRWALHKAIDDYLRWRAAGLRPVRVAVNVSVLQLRNRGFVAEVGQALAVHADAPEGLELEITESMIMDDVRQSIATLQAIRTMGPTIAIDDFGTGFSSLGYLAKLPVDTLKIDRSFVIEMTLNPEGMALVSTIIALAHSLKLRVVAEGVETTEQARLLHLLNCDQAQGYLYSRPVPAAEFEAKFLGLPVETHAPTLVQVQVQV